MIETPTTTHSSTFATTYSRFLNSEVRIDFVSELPAELSLYIFQFNLLDFKTRMQTSLVSKAWRTLVCDPTFNKKINEILISSYLLDKSKIDSNPWDLLRELHFSDCRFYVDASLSMRVAKPGEKRKTVLCDAIRNTAEKYISSCFQFVKKIKLFSFAQSLSECFNLPNELTIRENLDASAEKCKSESTYIEFLQPLLQPFERRTKNSQKERLVVFVISDLVPQGSSVKKVLDSIENIKQESQRLWLVFIEAKNKEETEKEDEDNTFKTDLLGYAKRNSYLTVVEEEETFAEIKASDKKKQKFTETDHKLQKEGSAQFCTKDQGG